MPKILLITEEVPQTVNAGSIQFYRLFKDYPSENLLVFGKAGSAFGEKLCCRYEELDFPLAEKLRLSRFNRWKANLESLGILNYRLPKKLEKIAKDFDPDIVISLMQLYSYYYTAYKFGKKYKIPFVLICHDDSEVFSRISPCFLPLLVKKNKKIYQYAVQRFCISPEMVSIWNKKYDATSRVLYPLPSHNISSRSTDETQELKVPDCLTLGYAGSLAYGYKEGISDLIPVLSSSEKQIRIFIYKNRESSLCHPQIIFRGYSETPELTWERMKKECDVLLLPYSFDKKFEILYRSHFPSKLTEYLMLGMPIIVRGPKYATGVKWAQQHISSDAVITESKLEDAIQKFTLIRETQRIRLNIAQACISTGRIFFDPIKIKKEFFSSINRVINSGNF